MPETNKNLHIFSQNNEKATQNNQFDKKYSKVISQKDLSQIVEQTQSKDIQTTITQKENLQQCNSPPSNLNTHQEFKLNTIKLNKKSNSKHIEPNQLFLQSIYSQVQQNLSLNKFLSKQRKNNKNQQLRQNFIKQKLNKLQKIANQLNSLKEQIIENQQNMNFQKLIHSPRKHYYLHNLVQSLSSQTNNSHNMIFLQHFSKNFQILQDLYNKKLLNFKMQNFKVIIRSNNIHSRGFPILILDLDEGFFILQTSENHCQKNSIYSTCKITGKQIKYELKMRPYLHKFLQQCSKYFQIYVFTSKSEQLIRQILIHLDPKQLFISKVLIRDEQYLFGNHQQEIYMKNLQSVICDINRVIIISTNISSYELQLKNGVPLAPFNENIEDNELQELLQYLLTTKNDEHFKQTHYSQYYNKYMPSALIVKTLFD